jgi:integrase
MKHLSTLLASYRATQKSHLKWCRTKDYSLDRIADDLGKWPLSRVTAPNLQAWAQASPRAPSVKYQMLAFLSEVIKFGQLWWHLPVRPEEVKTAIAVLKLYKIISSSNQRDRRVTDAELDRIRSNWTCRAVPSDPLVILRDTAMRVSELTALHWADVDLDGRTALLRHRKARGAMRISIPGKLKHWHRLRNLGSDRVCPTSSDTLSAAFRRAARGAQVLDIRLHDLRHEGTSRLAERGLSPAQMQAVTGHKSIQNLERYTHVQAHAVASLFL